MSIEEKLKHFIVMKFGSVRKFAPYTGLPYSTIISILRRGVDNCNGQNLQMICDALNISQKALLEGKIEETEPIVIEYEGKADDFSQYINHFIDRIVLSSEDKSDQIFLLEGKPLNKSETDYIKTYIEVMMDYLRKKRKENEDEK